jgi:hypothetical protein
VAASVYALHQPSCGSTLADKHTRWCAPRSVAAVCPAAGATGGFAGGEAGLKQFVATGELKLRDPSQPAQRQTSPVAVAGLLVAGGAGGGLLLNQFFDAGEGAIKAEILEVSPALFSPGRGGPEGGGAKTGC